MDDDSVKRIDPEPTQIDPDESPFGPVPISGLPLDRDERRALDAFLAKIDAARAKVGPREYAYTDDSPFGIPPE